MRASMSAHAEGRREMADRKPFRNTSAPDEELLELLRQARGQEVTDEDFREQQISFAYGNMLERENITKESVRQAAKRGRAGTGRIRT